MTVDTINDPNEPRRDIVGEKNTFRVNGNEHEDRWMGGKGARLSPKQYRITLKRVIAIWGSMCFIPDCPHPEESLPEINLTLHHLDGNSANHMLSDMQPAHFRCNDHWQKVVKPQHDNEREKQQGAHVLTSQDRLRPVSAEIAKNEDYEPIFRRKAFEKMLDVSKKKGEDAVITQKALRVYCRTWVGCSSQASYSYMEPLFAEKEGPFEEELDSFTQSRYCKFRLKTDEKLTVAQLEAKYPKEGKRFSKEI